MSDLCFSWPMLNHVLSQAELMDQMMSRLGVNPAVAARIDRGAAFYEARTRCIDCPVNRIMPLLADIFGSVGGAPRFLPNRGVL